MSLDEAVMDLSDVFEFGQGYVALSRVKLSDCIFLVGMPARFKFILKFWLETKNFLSPQAMPRWLLPE